MNRFRSEILCMYADLQYIIEQVSDLEFSFTYNKSVLEFCSVFITVVFAWGTLPIGGPGRITGRLDNSEEQRNIGPVFCVPVSFIHTIINLKKWIPKVKSYLYAFDLNFLTNLWGGPGSSSGKVLSYGLDGSGSIPGVEGVEIFLRSFVSRLVLRSTQPPIK